MTTELPAWLRQRKLDKFSSYCTHCYDVAPVQVGKRGLREDVEVRLEFLQRLDNCRAAIGLPLLSVKRHDVLFLLDIRFSGEVACTNSGIGFLTSEDWGNVQERVSECGVVWLLSKDFADFRVESFVRLNELSHERVGVGGDVREEVIVLHRHLGQGRG